MTLTLTSPAAIQGTSLVVTAVLLNDDGEPSMNQTIHLTLTRQTDEVVLVDTEIQTDASGMVVYTAFEDVDAPSGTVYFITATSGSLDANLVLTVLSPSDMVLEFTHIYLNVDAPVVVGFQIKTPYDGSVTNGLPVHVRFESPVEVYTEDTLCTGFSDLSLGTTLASLGDHCTISVTAVGGLVQLQHDMYVAQPPPLSPSTPFVVTLLSRGRRSMGFLYADDDGIYIVTTLRGISGDTCPLVLLPDVNGKLGHHVLLVFNVIGFERSSDIAVLKYDPMYGQNNGFVLDSLFLRNIRFPRPQFAIPTFQVTQKVYITGMSDIGNTFTTQATVQTTPFFGTGKGIRCRGLLVAPAVSEDCMGAPVIDQDTGIFIGLVSSTYDETLTYVVDATLVNSVILWIQRHWNESELSYVSSSPYVISNMIKRGFQHRSYLGITHEFVSFDSLSTLPALKALPSFGGILLTGFIHGFDTVNGKYILSPTQPISQTDIKVYSVVQGSEMYNDFFASNNPLVLKSITYTKKINPFATSGETTDILGQFNYQLGLSDFNFFTAYPFDGQAFSIKYYVLYSGSTWTEKEETFTPSPVTYRDESGNLVTQSNADFPFPLYGLEELGSVQYL